MNDEQVPLASDMTAEEILRELEDLWLTSSGDSAGHGWTREELHERPSVVDTNII